MPQPRARLFCRQRCKAALSCPEELGQPCSPCAVSSLPSPLPETCPEQPAHSGWASQIHPGLPWPAVLSLCCCYTGVLTSKNEVEIFHDSNRARSATSQGEEAHAAPRIITACDSTKDLGHSGLEGRGEQPLCCAPGQSCPLLPAALGDPQPSVRALSAAGAAQNVTNPRTARRKPKGCHSCPRPQSLELPDHLLYSWGLSGTPP